VEDLLDEPETRARLHQEFADDAENPMTIPRRDLLRLMGATAALAGMSGCMQEPRQQILPYAKTPAGLRPGEVQHYATHLVCNGLAEGVLVKAIDGRPLKIDGNPEHPASLGGSSMHQQALLFELYDPQRARVPTQRGIQRPLEQFVRDFVRESATGVRFLLEPTSSPSLIDLLQRLAKKLPGSRTYFHGLQHHGAVLEGVRLAAGKALLPRYDFSAAGVIVSIGADFLCSEPPAIRSSRDFANGRRLVAGATDMNRLYVIETDLSVTGMAADHRLARRPSGVADAGFELLKAVAVHAGAAVPEALRARLVRSSAGPDGRWMEVTAGDLWRKRGASLVLAGQGQPAEVHAAVYAINALLGNDGKTVLHAPSPIHRADEISRDLAALTTEMEAGAVETLVILEGNPLYTAPGDLKLKDALARVRRTAYCGLYENETARQCEWFIPVSQQLERWDDARAFDGTVSIGQPLIRPLYETRSPSEILAAFLGETDAVAHDIVNSWWAGRAPLSSPGDWGQALQRGVVPETAFPPESVEVQWDQIARLISERESHGGGGLQLHVRPDWKVQDGRWASNLWLLELADPVTKLTWENAALVSPRTAVELNLESGTWVRITRGTHEIALPALVLPGHADGAVTVPSGFGPGAKAWEGDCFADAVGTDIFPLTALKDAPGVACTVERLQQAVLLPVTQTHGTMEGRPIGIVRTLAEHRRDPKVITTLEPLFSLFGPFDQSFPEQWGMAIDLTVCTGCSACVLACQAENNLPVVGKTGVLKSREMHWIRIDRYFNGAAEAPGVLTQPMLCQHCESAPCEYVCPVNATTHSPDGLNEMTYNRCVGTRFCQNNCPYKVRRFNWFDFNIRKPPTLRMMMNPEVTVRARGVIEKCTYCVQRIRGAQITAQKENRALRDQEVRTACQEACPTGAIMFGNLADKDALVTRWMKDPRTYRVLEELGTRPRTRYLARITNPNPELA
jgi:molybdopterin-containing oxidoreductase family iron-sulfur binding subunit